MANESILLGSPLTSAFAEVIMKKGAEGVTAGHSELSEFTRAALQAGYHDLKERMAKVGNRIDFASYQMKLSMGRYQASGRYFPHIWGAFIPQEAVRCSRITPQLYVFRKEKAISWGLCPSDKALKNQAFMAAFRKALVANEAEISALFARGFRGRTGAGRDKQPIETPQEFLKSGELAMSRFWEIADLSPEKLELVLLEDLQALFPLYVRVVTALRAAGIWSAKSGMEDEEKRHWLIAAGASGEMWDTFKSESIVAVGFNVLKKSLRDYSSRSEMEDDFKTANSSDGRPTNQSLACDQFANAIKPGDYIFAKAGKSKLLAFGEVVSDYQYLAGKIDYAHVRKVKWLSIGPWLLPEGESLPTKTLTDISGDEGYVARLKQIAGIGEDGTLSYSEDSSELATAEGKRVPRETPDLPSLVAKTGKAALFFQSIARRLEEKKQVIFYGPPGTGKTFIANAFADWFQGAAGLREQIQFHPSYSYEDFIEGFRPAGGSEKAAGFALKSGAFKSFCEKASKSAGKHIFIIDEVNRGNLASIFGELLFALEYRDKEVTLPYSGEKFKVPANVYVIGTMNSADRSIAIIDFAIRRRFDFFEFSPDIRVLKRFLEGNKCEVDVEKLISSFKKLNEMISERRGKPYEIGHSYWMASGLTAQALKDIWDYNIRPLLEEYFFDEPAIVQKIAEDAWGYQDETKVAA